MALYKKALVVGATSGIGEALAVKLAETGTHVIAVGRREDRLQALVGKAPQGTISIMILDITELSSIATFAQVVLAAHPDLDAVILNSGVQRAFDFGKPETVDLATLELELKTNYTAYVYLVTAFLPHLQTLSKTNKAYLVFISATLGLVPTLVRTPNYNASKAALHSFITTMRQQQIDAGFEQLRVVEVFPPAVQTELHDTVHQPDLVGGDALGMPLAAFTSELFTKLSADPKLFVAIGAQAEALVAEGGLEDQRQKLFEAQQVHVKAAISKFLKKD
ncbi:UV-damaged DNA-binding protein rad7 [Sporothrix bragantina]|uniref:UV-damaged DNA-binding protein rad7 n=1 Tax=Sporothrix bragantina TaxID=671064 RepID=A0ABP0CIB0_9PEZI